MEQKLKDFVIKLRKKHREIERQIIFCKEHNFNIEAEAKRGQADVLRRTIHDFESEFDLGFVWDDSLND